MRLTEEQKALLELATLGASAFCAVSESVYHADMNQVCQLAREQGVTALCWSAVEQLYKRDINPCSSEVKLKWYAGADQVNKQIRRKIDEITQFSSAVQPLRLVALKGIDYAKLWPNPCWREFGDLDCKVINGDSAALEDKAKAVGCDVEEAGYKHSHIRYKGLMVENHYYISSFGNSKEGRLIEEELSKLLVAYGDSGLIGNTCLLSPNSNFTAVFMLVHMQRHFFEGGITLRHLLDWFFFLKKERTNVNWDIVTAIYEKIHIKAFADLVTLICQRELRLKTGAFKITTDFSDEEVERFVTDIFTYSYNPSDRSLKNRVNGILTRFSRMWTFRKIMYLPWYKGAWEVIAFTKYIGAGDKIKH